jgi:hypothetical protein
LKRQGLQTGTKSSGKKLGAFEFHLEKETTQYTLSQSCHNNNESEVAMLKNVLFVGAVALSVAVVAMGVAEAGCCGGGCGGCGGPGLLTVLNPFNWFVGSCGGCCC